MQQRSKKIFIANTKFKTKYFPQLNINQHSKKLISFKQKWESEDGLLGFHHSFASTKQTAQSSLR